jgi:hypothetical protein
MSNILYFILLLNASLLLNFNRVNGQSSKKRSVSFYSKLNEIKISDIKNGKHLDVAKELPVDRFVQYYLEVGKKVQSKKYGDYVLFEELYKDSLFTYFGRTYTYGLIDFIKVSNGQLPSGSFITLDGQELRRQFINTIIPQEDKSRVNRKDKDCASTTYSQDFKYKYIKETNEIEVDCYWKIKCDFLYTIINKQYKAKYNIDERQFAE